MQTPWLSNNFSGDSELTHPSPEIEFKKYSPQKNSEQLHRLDDFDKAAGLRHHTSLKGDAWNVLAHHEQSINDNWMTEKIGVSESNQKPVAKYSSHTLVKYTLRVEHHSAYEGKQLIPIISARYLKAIAFYHSGILVLSNTETILLWIWLQCGE